MYVKFHRNDLQSGAIYRGKITLIGFIISTMYYLRQFMIFSFCEISFVFYQPSWLLKKISTLLTSGENYEKHRAGVQSELANEEIQQKLIVSPYTQLTGTVNTSKNWNFIGYK